MVSEWVERLLEACAVVALKVAATHIASKKRARSEPVELVTVIVPPEIKKGGGQLEVHWVGTMKVNTPPANNEGEGTDT
jgi:hypothetical protein